MRKLVGLSLAVAVLLGGSAFGVERRRPRRVVRKHPKVGERIRDKYDRNDDGKLGSRERAKLRKDFREKARDKREERRDNIVNRFDKDDDGKLTGDERLAARDALKKFHHGKHFAAWKKSHSKLWKKLLGKYDADGNGKLDEAERKALREACGERREKLVEKFDKDGDGKLNAKERAALRRAMGIHRGHKSFIAWLKKNPGMRKKLLARFDADGDGKLSEAERKKLQQVWAKRHKPSGVRAAKGKGKCHKAAEDEDVDGDF